MDLAQEVRREMESVARMEKFPADLCGLCARASYKLQTRLRAAGIEVDFVYGEFDTLDHCWVVYKKKIVDITATQFGLSFPSVYVTSVHDQMYHPIERNGKAEDEVVKWDCNQAPPELLLP